jgi:hypothetical protein
MLTSGLFAHNGEAWPCRDSAWMRGSSLRMTRGWPIKAVARLVSDADCRIADPTDRGYWWMGSVIARSPQGDEAIQRFATDMDCFASLAMTMI